MEFNDLKNKHLLVDIYVEEELILLIDFLML